MGKIAKGTLVAMVVAALLSCSKRGEKPKRQEKETYLAQVNQYCSNKGYMPETDYSKRRI